MENRRNTYNRRSRVLSPANKVKEEVREVPYLAL